MKRFVTRLFLFGMLSLFLAVAVSVPGAAKVKLSRKSLTLRVNNTLTLFVKGSKKTVSWFSADTSIATVTNVGLVKGIKKGQTTVFAQVGKKKLSCKVKVKKAAPPFPAPTQDPAKRTLRNYLAAALVPCGRTLYIYGGGWGEKDYAVTGYQNSWYTFFKKKATPGYNYKKYKYKHGKGLDCSGFAAWTLYNTLYTGDKQADLRCSSNKVAAWYADRGWADLSTGSADMTFRPGDVVSRSGHVWICLGSCSDKSVLFIHSTPQGVQISGTVGQAARLARHYMKKYFTEWPYEAKTVRTSYLKYVGKARWRLSGDGTVLSDPEGMQNKSADEVMKILLGN